MEMLRRQAARSGTIWVAIVVALLLSSYRLSLYFGDRLRVYFDQHTERSVADWISNALFAALLVVLIIAYSRWRRAIAHECELEAVIAGINPDTLLVVDPDRRIVFANPAMTAMFGYAQEELVGQTTDALYGDRRVSGEPREIFRYLQKMGFHVGRATAKHKNGKTFPIEIVTGQIGHRPGVVILIRDITDQASAEDALRESERRYRLLAENATDLIWTTDVNLRLQYVSPAITALTGYTPEEALRLSLDQILTPASLELVLQTHREELAEAERNPSAAVNCRRLELELRCKEGATVWTETNAQLLKDDGGRPIGALGVTRDTTERRQMEQQFLQAQKLESVGRLAGSIAHDFNNLLTIINGYSSMLLARPSNRDATDASAIEEIRKAGERALSLTQRLLAFSRRQPAQPRDLNLNTVISDIEKMLHRLIGEDIELLTALDPEVGSVHCDPTQIEQVLMNLAVNARDAMPGGGKLIIETRNFRVDAGVSDSTIKLPSGSYVLLSISDTGAGMSDEVKSHLFEPFFTTKDKGKGSGLGLCTVYGIVTQSRGHVRVYSELGNGTTIRVFLPRVDQAASTSASSWGSESKPRGSGTVLLVEDETDVRRLARGMLKASGYEVIEARNGVEGLAVIEQFHGHIDLLITDVVMPRMGGRELYDKSRTTRPGMKALFISAHTEDVVQHHGILHPHMAFLSKPFTHEELARKLLEVLHGPAAPLPPSPA